MKLIKDITSYVKDLTELIWNFILHRDHYPDNALLCVQPEVMANVIDDPTQCRHCDVYDPKLLIKPGHDGQPIPDHAAIKRVAQRYYEEAC